MTQKNRQSKKSKNSWIIILLLLFLLLFGFWYMKGPKEAEPEQEQKQEETAPVEQTEEDDFQERLREFLHSHENMTPEIEEALIAQGTGIPDAKITSVQKKYEAECAEDKENKVIQLEYEIEGISPDLIYLTTRDLEYSGEPDNSYSYTEILEGIYKSDICLITAKDTEGYITTKWEETENGTYLAEAVQFTEYGYAQVIPQIMCVTYDEKTKEFSLQFLDIEPATVWEDITVVNFRLKEEEKPAEQEQGSTHHSGGESTDSGTEQKTEEDTSKQCCNKSGCERKTFHCIFCDNWHCDLHICDKMYGYCYWCDTQAGNYEVSAYAEEKAYFEEPEKAAKYESWIPEYEAFGIHYNDDFWYDD